MKQLFSLLLAITFPFTAVAMLGDLFALLHGSGAATAAPKVATKLPPGTLAEGTMTNVKLRRDTLMFGVWPRLAHEGCKRFIDFRAYILAMPKGKPGARVWRERWLINCGPTQHSVDVGFQETGSTGVNWTVGPTPEASI